MLKIMFSLIPAIHHDTVIHKMSMFYAIRKTRGIRAAVINLIKG